MNKAQKWIAEKVLGIKFDSKALSGSYQIVGGTLTAISDNKQNYISEGYSVNDIVYSIINLILDKIRIAPWGLYKVVDESSLKRYNAILKKNNLSGADYKEALHLRKKALEPILNPNMSAGKLAELLKWPNEEESFSDFITNGCGYKLLTGDKYIWANILDGGANKGLPQELWLLPSQNITIKSQGLFPMRRGGYTFSLIGRDFAKEEVLHEKYWNPTWGVSGPQLYGVSPLKAALKNLARNNSAKEASAAKFQNNGLEAVVFVDDQRLSGDEANAQASALKAKLISEYSGPKNQGKIAASGYKVGVANLGLSPVELGIIDAEKWDAIMLCGIYGVPPELLGLTQKTYNNVTEAEKALTTRSALPLLTSMRESLNRKLQTDWGFKGQNVYCDFGMEVFTELQDDMKEMTDWIMPLMDRGLPMNRALDLMGLEKIDDPYYDEPRVTPQMGDILSDYQPNEVDRTLNEEEDDEERA
jgi:HK97 family phage portal protein